ncbi:MAG TPA: hypothetical protein VN025_14755 [Candidatus Dormibacteraeota bacterium]|jgi:hypothetical protein|nr:hypothetical protein [Candidatus Dormibacteraeota bacterium]
MKWPSWFPIGQHERLNIVLTSAIALLTAGNVVIAYWYSSITKHAAESNGRQVDKLIYAANIQAQAARDFANAASSQAEEMKTLSIQAIEQAKATNNLAIEAKRSADYARQSLSDTQAALHLEESPWIGIAEIKPNDFPDGSETLVVVFKNYGKSPGFGAHGYFETQFISPGVHTDWTFTESRARGTADFFPDQINSIPLNVRLSPVTVAQFKSGQVWLNLRIGLWYRDYWNVPRMIKFCQFFDSRSQQWVARKPERCED